MKMQKFIKVWIGILLVGLLAGCTSAMYVNFNADHQLNPNQQHRALPVQVNIYQLSDKDAFDQATFRELWQQDTKILGNSLISKRQVIIKPGDTTAVKIDRAKDSRYIGIVALFRKPDGDSWRVMYELASTSSFVFSLKIHVDLHKNQIALEE